MTQIQKLTIGLGLMAGVAGAWSFTSLRVVSDLSTYLEVSVGATTAGIDQLGQIGRAASDMVGTERALVLHSMFGQAPEAEQDKKQFDSSATALEGMISSLPQALAAGEAANSVQALKDGMVKWRKLHQTLNSWLDKQQADEAEKLLRSEIKPVADGMQDSSRRLSASGKALLQAGIRDAAAKVGRSRWSAVAFIAVFLMTAIGLLSIVRRTGRRLAEVSGNIAETAAEVASAAGQVATVSRDLSGSTSAQAAAIEETSASTREVESSSQQNARGAREAASVMAQVDRKVGEANHTLDQMVSSMNEIRLSSDNIGRIIKVVDEIAFQTNILALNAAVEAARAGEAGLSFAVVADEVRNLAQRSAKAARDTTELVEESSIRARAGGERLDQVMKVIAGITTDASRVKQLIDAVESASQQQAEGIRQISQALHSMETMTSQSAAGARESELASQGLDSQASGIRAIVLELAKVVG